MLGRTGTHRGVDWDTMGGDQDILGETGTCQGGTGNTLGGNWDTLRGDRDILGETGTCRGGTGNALAGGVLGHTGEEWKHTGGD